MSISPLVALVFHAPQAIVRLVKLVYHPYRRHQQLAADASRFVQTTFKGWRGYARPRNFPNASGSNTLCEYVTRAAQVPGESGGRVSPKGVVNGPSPQCGHTSLCSNGNVRTSGNCFLGWSPKAHSGVQQVVPPIAPPHDKSHLPLWHCVSFRNDFRCTYSNTKLIEEGVMTWGQCQDVDNLRFLNFMPCTWMTVYSRGTHAPNSVKSKEVF